MNIKFGMDNFYVRYLKRFLNKEMSHTSTILGEFDKTDLQLLIEYLNLPNVKDMFDVQKEILEKFPELNTYFNFKLQNNMIYFSSKQISKEISEYLIDNSNNIREYCESCGWQLVNMSEWVDTTKDINNDGIINEEDRQILHSIIYDHQTYDEIIMKRADLNLDGIINEEDINVLENYLITGNISFTIQQGNRKNYFPNKDMLVFVNQFDGTFMYNYAIRTADGTTDNVHYDNLHQYKIALYKCKPGQKITIAHNNPHSTRLVIGSSAMKLKQDIKNNTVYNVADINLSAGQSYQYTCSSRADGSFDAQWVCIQCPSNYNDLTSHSSRTVLLEVGDINFDGRIDLQDYHLLARYTATGPGSEQMHWEATDKQKAVMDTNKDGVINNKDAIRLKKFIDGDPGIPSLGLTSYTYTVSSDSSESDNVSNLLIIDGHYNKSTNIPFNEFISNDWVIHEKFFNYLLGMAIHKYSTSTDITYLQKLLKERYPEHIYDKSFFYPGFYNDNMKQLMLDYQKSKQHYTLGDLNLDNKIDKVDLRMLREYLDTLKGDINQDGYTNEKDLQLLTNYLKNPYINPLTEEQLKIADINKDGQVNQLDLELLKELVDKASTYSKTFLQRADVNQDGYVNETDYQIMEREVNENAEALKQYDIRFILGWCDCESESLLENDVNISGNLSEVSK